MNILVVEAEQDLRDMIADELRNGGHRVYDVIDYEQGIKLAEIYALDLVITALRISEHCGFDFIRRIAPKYPRTRFLFIRCQDRFGDPQMPADVAAMVLPGDLIDRKMGWLKTLLPD